MPKELTPLRAIHKYCTSVCMLEQPREVPKCTCKACPLYGYRNGHRPETDNKTATIKRDKSKK